MKKNIAIIGAGHLGVIIARMLRKMGFENITLTRRASPFEAELTSEFNCHHDNRLAVWQADIVIFCSLPAQLPGILLKVQPVVTPEKIIISAVSRRRIEEIKQSIGMQIPVIRIMPNIALSVGASMTFLSHAGESDMCMAEVAEIFSHAGAVLPTSEEKLNLGTIFSGSMPAILAYLIEPIKDRVSLLALPDMCHPITELMLGYHYTKWEANLILAQCWHGLKELLKQGLTLQEIIKEVCTIGGCTHAVLRDFDDRGVRGLLKLENHTTASCEIQHGFVAGILKLQSM